MTHILIPREPSPALLRPCTGCPADELPLAWAAMVRAAEVQNARAGAATAAVAPQGVVAWMHPETLNVISAAHKHDMSTEYGAETRRKAESPSVALVRAEQPAAVTGPALALVERQALEALCAVAVAAFHAADDSSDNGNIIEVQRADFEALDAALDLLDELPDDQPGYTMTPGAKAKWALRRLLDAAPALEAPAAPVPELPGPDLWRDASGLRGYTKDPGQGPWYTAETVRSLLAAAPQAPAAPSVFQQRVQPWLMECFGPVISADKQERNHRFLEEALETVQAAGCTASEAHQLVDYVFGRPVGELGQEVGGAMTTLAALCLANGIDMHAEAEKELARVWTMVEKIRAKQAAKPKHSPLPAAPAAPAVDARAERDAAFEAVRNRLCGMQRYSFVLDDDGAVRRVKDRTGNWVEFDDAHALFDPVAVDAAIAAQAKEGGA